MVVATQRHCCARCERVISPLKLSSKFRTASNARRIADSDPRNRLTVSSQTASTGRCFVDDSYYRSIHGAQQPDAVESETGSTADYYLHSFVNVSPVRDKQMSLPDNEVRSALGPESLW